MAKNVIREIGNQLDVAVTHPANPKSGDIVRWGEKIGVALADTDPDTGLTPVKFDGTVLVPVKGVNASGNSAVAAADEVFYTDADTPAVSKKATGTLVGQAMGVVASGATTAIEIRLAG
ncbi:capsid cement protein [Melissospora conviva]|uniref:capsid cement protein n=1 Tax=Melissospora conviva TaxID=3388432 RepID=UPI003C2720BB